MILWVGWWFTTAVAQPWSRMVKKKEVGNCHVKARTAEGNAVDTASGENEWKWMTCWLDLEPHKQSVVQPAALPFWARFALGEASAEQFRAMAYEVYHAVNEKEMQRHWAQLIKAEQTGALNTSENLRQLAAGSSFLSASFLLPYFSSNQKKTQPGTKHELPGEEIPKASNGSSSVFRNPASLTSLESTSCDGHKAAFSPMSKRALAPNTMRQTQHQGMPR